MNSIPNLRRSKLTRQGIWFGTTLSLGVAGVYALVTFLLFFLYFDLSSSGETVIVKESLSDLYTFLFFPGGFLMVGMSLIGIIPAILLGALNGALIGFILGAAQKKTTNLIAISVGITTSIILVLIVNFLYWLLYSSFKGGDFWQFFLYPFYLYYPRAESFLSFIVNNVILPPNLYFLPSMIAIPLSGYMGWKINRFDTLNSVDQYFNI